MKIIVFLSSLLLLANAQECVWPEAFFFNHSESWVLKEAGKNIPGYFALNLNYESASEAVYRSDGSYDHICGPLSGHKNTPCLQLATKGVRYIIHPELQECCKCCTYENGCGPIGTFWTDGAVNEGIVDIAGTPSYNWEIMGSAANYLYLAANDSRVTGLNNSGTDVFIADMSTYSTTPNNALFEIPEYCSLTKHCSRKIFPCLLDGEEEEEEKENDPLSPSEISRASTWVPSQEYQAPTLPETSSVLNSHLDTRKDLQTRACREWTLPQLDEVQRWLNSRAHPELLEVYSEARDPRQIKKGASGGNSQEELEKEWEKMREVAEGSELAEQLLVTGRCRESVMWYIHALSRKSQEEFVEEDLVLPRLPTQEEQAHVDVDELKEGELWAYKEASRLSVCAQCHVGSV